MLAKFRTVLICGSAMIAMTVGAAAQAPAQPAPPPQPPQFPNMTFFITGAPGPDGANFGGIEGADAVCQRLATSAGAGGKT